MTLFELFVLTMAIGHAIDVWFNGEIFAEWRMATSHIYLLTCSYCLTVHVSVLLLVIATLAPLGLGWYLLYALAAMRLSWLFNKLLPPDQQYQPPDVQEATETRKEEF